MGTKIFRKPPWNGILTQKGPWPTPPAAPTQTGGTDTPLSPGLQTVGPIWDQWGPKFSENHPGLEF